MKSIHRLWYPFEEYGLRRILCGGDNILQECLLLGVKSSQHISSDSLAGFRAPNADTEASKLPSPQCLDQGLHAIMSSIPPFLFNFDLAKDKIYVIMNE